MPMQFFWYEDPGHSWLLVTRREILELGLTESDISAYSYQRGDTIALEEDEDAGTFLNAWILANRALPEFVTRQGSPRDWPSYGKRDYHQPRPDLQDRHKQAMALRETLRQGAAA